MTQDHSLAHISSNCKKKPFIRRVEGDRLYNLYTYEELLLLSHQISEKIESYESRQGIKTHFFQVLSECPFLLFSTSLAIWAQKKAIIPINPKETIQEKTNRLIQLPDSKLLKISSLKKHITVTIEDEVIFSSPLAIEKNLEKPFLNHVKELFSSPFEQEALIIMTSGTTGPAKGVALSLKNLVFSARGTNQFYNFNQEDIWALTLPSHHIGGFMILVRSFIQGASTTTISNPNQNQAWKEHLHPDVNFYSFVPAQLHEIINNPNNQTPLITLSCAKAIIIGGAPAPKNLLRKAKEKSLLIYLTYGQSEMSSQVTSTKNQEFLSDHNGQNLRFRKIRVENENIYLSGETRFLGHYIEKRLHHPFNSQGEYLAPDKGTIDTKGNLTILGRKDRVFISGGENVNPEEVESYFKEKMVTNHSSFFTPHILEFKDDKFGQKAALLYQHSDVNDPIQRDQIESSIIKLVDDLPAHEKPSIIKPLFLNNNQDQNSLKVSRERLIRDLQKHLALKKSLLNIYVHGSFDSIPIVFIHGFMGSRKDFFPLWNEMNKSDIQDSMTYIAVELPGHGLNETNKLDLYQSFSEVCRDLAKSIETINKAFQRPLNLYAYSMGGRLLMQSLVNHPEIHSFIQTTFISSAHPGLQDLEQKQLRKKQDQSIFSSIKHSSDWDPFIGKWYQQPLFGSFFHNNKKWIQQKIKEEKVRWSSETLSIRWQKAINLMSVSNQDYLLPKLTQLPFPLYLNYGRLDHRYKKITYDMFNYLKSHNLKRVEIKEFDCAHSVHLENYHKLSKYLKEIIGP